MVRSRPLHVLVVSQVRKLLWLGWLLWAATLACAAPRQVTLDNGLKVVVAEDHSAPVATVHLFVGTGSIYEGEYLGSGISHLLEHVISDASATRTNEQIELDEARLGNVANAYTSKSTVGYFVVTSGDQVQEAIDHLADYVFHPTFPEEAVKTQQGVILREMARGDDDPFRQLYETFQATMFRASPEGIPIIGNIAQFEQLTRADLVALHRRFYVPGNVVAVAVGDFSAEQVLAHMREVLGRLPARTVQRPLLTPEPPQIAPRRVVKHEPQITRAYLMLGYPTVSLFSPDLYALDVASYILTNGDASRLVAKLRDEQGLVNSVASWSATPPYDAGFFAVNAVMEPEKAPAAEAAILAELQRLQRQPVTRAELERAKRQKQADLVFAQTSTQGRARIYGEDLLTTGDLGFSDLYVERIQQVTAQDVQRVAQKYFVPTRLNTVLLTPAAEAATAPPTAPAAGPAGEAEIQEARLANGLRLLVQENHAVPVVNLFLAAPGGLRYEDENQVGITSLMSSMLVRGTRTRNRLQIAQALENVGGSLAPYSGRNSFGLSAQVRTADLPLAIEMAADVLANPIFPEAELQQQKQLQLAGLRARNDDVDTFAGDLLLRTLFQRYPYRFPPGGTMETVAKLTRQDLLTFHQALVKPESMVLAVFGDTTLAQARQLAERTFGLLPGGALQLKPAEPEPPPAEPRVERIARPQQQAIVTYGFRSGPVNSADRHARDVMNAVFAGLGYPGGRLHAALRGAELVYATWAYSGGGPQVGYFVIYAGTAPDKAGVVQETVEKLIADLKAAPPSAEELALAKTIAIANHAVRLESSADRAQAVGINLINGLPAEEIFRYAEQVNQVTAAQVQQQAREILDLTHSVRVITTPEAPAAPQ